MVEDLGSWRDGMKWEGPDVCVTCSVAQRNCLQNCTLHVHLLSVYVTMIRPINNPMVAKPLVNQTLPFK